MQNSFNMARGSSASIYAAADAAKEAAKEAAEESKEEVKEAATEAAEDAVEGYVVVQHAQRAARAGHVRLVEHDGVPGRLLRGEGAAAGLLCFCFLFFCVDRVLRPYSNHSKGNDRFS